MKLSPKQRTELRAMFGDRCAYCGQPLPEKGWHADHVEPVLRDVSYLWDPKTRRHRAVTKGCFAPENDRLDNFFPACRACNIDKHAMSLEVWRKGLGNLPGVCRRNHSAFRHAERFGLVVEIHKPVVFWFERFRAEQAAAASSMGL